MARLQRFQAVITRRAAAGLLSALLHLGLAALILLSGGRAEGSREDAAPATRVVWLEPEVSVRRKDMEPPAQEPAAATSIPGEPRDPLRIEPPAVMPPQVEIPLIDSHESRVVDLAADESADFAQAGAAGALSTFVIPQAQASGIVQRIEHVAAELAKAPQTRVAWQKDGRHYEAELVLVQAQDGIEPDRAIAEITTEEQGRQLRTWISLKRLPFSHYAKLIDRWDPMVQLHDDEIVGRMHVNSRFNVLYDSQAAPRVQGKVTTAAGGFNLESRGRRPSSDVFSEGIETRAGRIAFVDDRESFDRAGQQPDGRVHELAGDTWIRFRADGGYSWREGRAGAWQHASGPAGQPVSFLAMRDAVVYVQGVVSGQFLVYSPRRIVVEGDITYARDARSDPDSNDYLGLVSDRDIVVAPAAVSASGDLNIHAALLARRRIVVADADLRSSATLNIFGSLAAGTLSESEPRYATKIEYDRRFDRRRPPGFPSTNRFAAEEWDQQWTEVPETAVAAGY
jgi:hypothetical protein